MTNNQEQTPVEPDAGKPKPDADTALARLREGNARFVSGRLKFANVDRDRRTLAADADQKDHALATVLACSDSRAPVEKIFDARLMELFVVRVAGGVVRRAQAASIEYGLLHVRTPLLAVLGHTDCGAVKAAIGQTGQESPASRNNVNQLIGSIEPAVERAIAACPRDNPEELALRAVEENVWQSIEDLFCSSPAVCRLVQEGKVKVIGAIYDLSTNKVNWLDSRKAVQILDRAQEMLSSLLKPWDEDDSGPDRFRAHVLIVDDEQDFLDSVSRRLGLRNFRVDAVDSGRKALGKIDANRYDTIIVDLSMPGLDGLETLKRALAQNADLQIVLLTGHATLKQGIEAMKLGALDFIEKPANIDLLIEMIMKGKNQRLKIDAAARERALLEAIERYGWRLQASDL